MPRYEGEMRHGSIFNELNKYAENDAMEKTQVYRIYKK